MEDLEQLNIELKNYLDKTEEQLIKDIVQLLKVENTDDLEKKAKEDTKALYFEYEYDYLDIVTWAVDKDGEIIGNATRLLSHREKEIGESEKWNSLLPEKIWDKAFDLQERYEDEEDWDDIWDEYKEEKYRLFEDWFLQCWKKALTHMESRNKLDAYFSIHDTYFRTDLNTFQTVNDDEIAERYTSK
ncbi:hypothetical protein CLU96_1480 [Chryseobacterium sp. 52]|uniref:hypothetical protein n=1 Tax=Chryseobacterium sp. 52 TaxID=2035213 RepID=UPI000C183D87|nr:hypothetical protein [Chryseobacterium sp. 52]PIF44504.1 hypothetical protein CLU96_1480 [Chryseobacterium sp. 52]